MRAGVPPSRGKFPRNWPEKRRRTARRGWASQIPGEGRTSQPPTSSMGPSHPGDGPCRPCPGEGAAHPKLCLTHLLPSAPLFSLHSKQRRRGGGYWCPMANALGEL